LVLHAKEQTRAYLVSFLIAVPRSHSSLPFNIMSMTARTNQHKPLRMLSTSYLLPLTFLQLRKRTFLPTYSLSSIPFMCFEFLAISMSRCCLTYFRRVSLKHPFRSAPSFWCSRHFMFFRVRWGPVCTSVCAHTWSLASVAIRADGCCEVDSCKRRTGEKASETHLSHL